MFRMWGKIWKDNHLLRDIVIENNKEDTRTHKVFEALDEIYRVVFEYKYLHELSDGEIADLLGITKKTVNVRIFRARKKLQAILTQTGGAK